MVSATTREILDIYPLTPAQQGILAETLAGGDSPRYLQHHVLELTGLADPDALRAALGDLIARHDPLRTGFAWDVGDQPLQVLRGTAAPRLTVEDLRGAAERVISERAARVLDEERQTPFDLRQPPLLRVRALRTRDTTWRLVTTHHHLVLDGWSVPLLLTELTTLLAAQCGQPRPPLPRVQSFRDFVSWQRSASDPAADEEYLKGLLGDVSAATPVGSDLPLTSGPAGEAAAATVFRPVAEDAHPERTARAAGLLPATVVHAAWALLLARWSGTEEVVFGTTVSGRSAQIDDAGQRIGMFLNTAAARIAVPDDGQAGPWLGAVQHSLEQIRRHEHAPLTLAARCSAMPPGAPLLSSVLAFQNYWRPAHGDISADGATVRLRVLSRAERPAVPVTVNVALPAEGIWVRIGYDPARVPPDAAAAVAEAMAALIERLPAADAAALLRDIPVQPGAPPQARPESSIAGALPDASRLAGLAAGAALVRHRLGLTAGDSVLAVLAPEEPVLPSVVLAALSAGCHLVLRDPRDSWPGAEPVPRPTVVVAAAPAAIGLLDQAAPGARIVLAGEPPVPDAVRRVLGSGRGAWRLWASGVTGGADVCAELRSPADALLLGQVPGGYPAAGGQPALPGRPGELVIVRPDGPCRTGLLVREAGGQRGLEQLGRTGADELVLVSHVLGLADAVGEVAVTPGAPGEAGPHAWLVPAPPPSGSAVSGSPSSDSTVARVVAAARAAAEALPTRLRPAGYTVLEALPAGPDGGTGMAALTAALRPAAPRREVTSRRDPVDHRLAALPPEVREAFLRRLRALAARTPGLRPGAAEGQARSQQQDEWHGQTRPARARAELTLSRSGAPGADELAGTLAALGLPPAAATLTVTSAGDPDTVTLTADPRWLDAGSLTLLAASVAIRPAQFRHADYAAWQSSPMRAAAREQHASHWRTVLGKAERPRWPTPGNTAAPPVTLARTTGTAPTEETAIAAAATALAFLAGAEEAVLGVVTRPELPAETAGLPGAFARTLPLRVPVPDGQPFAATTEAVRAALAAARAHGDVPWAVLEQLVPRPLALSVAVHDRQGLLAAHGDAALALDIAPGTITGTSRPDLAHPHDVHRLLDLTAAILGTAARRPDEPLRPADLTDDAMRTVLLTLGTAPPGDTAGTAGPEDTVLTAILRRCAETPLATAIEAPDQELSYGELAALAGGLAARLRGQGIGVEDRVAVCLPRHAAMAWAPLGVMLAGAAYLPLDSEHPAERRRLVLADSRARAVVTTPALAGEFPGIPTVLVSGERATPRRPAISPHAAAYVLYTSGSTGTPKGVVIGHAALASFSAKIAGAYHLDPSTRLLAFAAPTFDVSVFELWAGLAAGATIVLAGAEHRQAPQSLQRLLEDKRVTAAELPPALMPLLDPARLPELRLVSVGGEAPQGKLVDDWATPDREFWNGYGPTETTVAVTLMRCQPPSGGRVPPIGLPLPEHRAYVLDTHGRLVPPGVPGELCVAGPDLARGYQGLPGRTAASFVPDPYGPPGARMYRTGDLTRWTPDGVLEFLGRVDRQLKIRGFRIEPGEVEAALAAHPAVRQVTVQPWDAADGTRHLAAYVVPAATGAPPDLAGLRETAAARLPAYMLPTRLAILAELPRTAAGKVDATALPDPEAGGLAAEASDTTDWSPTERLLARDVVGPLTGAGAPGREEGFFELGGNSIQAAQVTARVRDKFGVEVSLVDFFREPTVAGLARLVDQAQGAAHGDAPGTATARFRMTAGVTVPLSFPQASLYKSCQVHGDLPGFHAPMALRLRGPLDTTALRRAFGLLAERHAPLRTTIAGEQGQHVHPPAEPPFEITDVPDGAPADRELLLRRALSAAAAEPFDLAASPPLRVRVHRMASDDHVLQWVIHHVATDGWSTGVQFHELGTAYTAFTEGREPVLAPLRADYEDFVSWHRRYVAGPDFRDDIAWWRDHLAGLPAAIRLPQAPGGQFRHGWRNLALPDQTATAVRAFTRAHGATLFMVTLAAFAVLVSAETGTDDLLTLTPTALRVRSAWEDLVGWFAHPVPIRVRVPGQHTFAQLAGQVRTGAMAALAHRNVPFELLRRELGLGPDAIATQLSVMNAPGRAITLAGLDIAVPADDSGRGFTPVLEVYSPPDSRYQLSVVLRERMGGVIAGGLEYDSAAFPDPATADRWHDAFLAILAAGAANPAITVSELRGHAS